MEPVLLDGKAVSEKIKQELRARVGRLTDNGKPAPTLATILVGNDPASATYVKMKGRACESVGIVSRRIEMSEESSTEELLQVIDDCNNDPAITGILLQHPVPQQIDERKAFDRILPEKDVDGVTSCGFGQISFGMPAYPSCTPAGIIRLLDEYEIKLEGMNAVVVGRSPILGRPMAMLLMNRNCTVTICHSRTRNLAEHLAGADLVVAAVGKPKFIKGADLKEGVVVVDAGYNPGNIGDADFESCREKSSFITPVPGGVGPMTIAMLLAHTVEAAHRRK